MNHYTQDEAKQQYEQYWQDPAVKVVTDAMVVIINNYVPRGLLNPETGQVVIDYIEYTSDPNYIKLVQELNQYRSVKYPLLKFS
ncbi:hypothetical protein [Spirosoma sp.]|uniref:hypothetical protein n=1 Tax=Spirosoma sp. TaxID=1899569 RepID=UPI002610C71C|nr:hypothetical protein [Spirosoma sp.]MCX6217591.1 hypothetical protein [Spirosoma sp.]